MMTIRTHDGNRERRYRVSDDGLVDYATRSGYTVGEQVWTPQLGMIEICDLGVQTEYGRRYRVRVMEPLD